MKHHITPQKCECLIKKNKKEKDESTTVFVHQSLYHPLKWNYTSQKLFFIFCFFFFFSAGLCFLYLLLFVSESVLIKACFTVCTLLCVLFWITIKIYTKDKKANKKKYIYICVLERLFCWNIKRTKIVFIGP